MPKPAKTSLTTAENSAFLSKIFLFLGIALFFFSTGIYTAKYFERNTIKSASEQERTMLFVQEIDKGSMVPLDGKNDTFDLSVRNEFDYITYNTQSATDITGRIKIGQYMQIWNTYLSQNLPIATLVIYNDEGNETVTIGQLQKAIKHEEKNRIDYTFRLLNVEELANLTLSKKPDQKRTDKFQHATLFINAPTKDLSGNSLTTILQEIQ